jgi:hypothetical protein
MMRRSGYASVCIIDIKHRNGEHIQSFIFLQLDKEYSTDCLERHRPER